MDDGGKKENPVFRSEDIEKSKANSDKEYFVNVIQDPFQQWLLRKKPSKVKVEQKFETPVAAPQVPTEKPKKPQCRTTIRLTTERLKRDSAKYKTTIIILAATTTFALLASIALAVLLMIGSNSAPKSAKVETKVVNVEKPSNEQISDLCEFYETKVSEGDSSEEYSSKLTELCPEPKYVTGTIVPERGGGENVD